MCKRACYAAVVMLFTGAIVFGNDDAIKEWLAKQPIKVGEKIEGKREDAFSAKGDTKGDTLMHLAAKDGRVDVMKWLKEQGEDINAKNNRERAPIHYAACGHRLFEFPRFFEILEMDIEPEQLSIKLQDIQIHLMARDRNLEAMKWLYEQGADINAKDDDDSPPIHYAVCMGNVETIKWLKEQGADINAGNRHGMPTLAIACIVLDGILSKAEDLLEDEFPELQAEDVKKIMLRVIQDIKEGIKWLKDNDAVIDDADGVESVDGFLQEADQFLKDNGFME